jgi:hypothetical protein
MPPAAASDQQSAKAAASLNPSGSAVPNINPATGLSTDYLNHFAEAVMVVELASTMPDCLEDLRTWRPRTYRERFTGSRFGNRDQVLAAFEAADPAVREALERSAEMLNDALTKTCEIVLRDRKKPEAARAAQWAVTWLKPLITRMAAVINGTAPDIADRSGPQATVDVMFLR